MFSRGIDQTGVTAQPGGTVAPLLAIQVGPRGVPTWVPRVVVPVTMAIVLVAMTVGDSGEASTAAETISIPADSLAALFAGLCVASMVVVLVFPTVGTVLAAACALVVVAVPDLDAGLPWLWGIALVIFAGLAAADLVTRRRRRDAVRTWSLEPGAAVLVPTVPQALGNHLTRNRVATLVWGGICLAAGAGFVTLCVHDVVATQDFRNESVVEQATVDYVDDTQSKVTVTIDGRTYWVPYSDDAPDIGQTLEVRYSPRSGRAEATNDIFDPTGPLFPAVPLLLVGAALVTRAVRRRQAMVALLTTGGPAVQLRATWSPGRRGAVLSAYDDATRVLAVAPALETWVGPMSPAPLEPPPAPGYPQAPAYPPAPGYGQMPGYVPMPAAWATAYPPTAAYALSMTWNAAPVVVVGLDREGGPAAIRDAEGRWHVTDAPVRAPRGHELPRQPTAPPPPTGYPWR